MAMGPKPRPAWERAQKWIDRNGPNGCWLWTGTVGNSRYGLIVGARKPQGGHRKHLVHRLAYENLVGPIPEGFTLDHLCKRRECVNPAHLEPVTLKENVLRADGWARANAAKTHCPRGHEYTPENTYTNKRNMRTCRTCLRMWDRERWPARRERSNARRRERANRCA